MTTTLLLIRHGQTDWNVAGRWQGHYDSPLNAAGLAQAGALARRLAGWPITVVYSSDLQRAAQTAAAVATACGAQLIHDPAWRERHVGQFEGLTAGEIAARFPDVRQSAGRGWLQPPGGEDQATLRGRVTAAYERLLARHVGETVAIVSHGGALHALICHLLAIAPGQLGNFSLRGNTGLSIVEVSEQQPRLVLLNDTSHLDPVYRYGG